MTRSWLLLLTLATSLAIGLPGPSLGQVDYDALRSGVAGCPELASDPDVGDLAAFLCRPLNRTSLDVPINAGNKLNEIRAGAFSTAQRAEQLTLVRGDIGEAEFARLQGLLQQADVTSVSQEALARALTAEAADPALDPALAAALRAQAAAIRAGKFDESIPALLAARIDRDRLADLRAGLLSSLVARDTVTPFAIGLAQSLPASTSLSGVPTAVDADGNPVFTNTSARFKAVPVFVGPDGIRDTPDDLPYVATNERAQEAGYVLKAPIANTGADRFDELDARFNIAKYSATAQKFVPNASNPSEEKLVELYGVYNPVYLSRAWGCPNLGGTFDPATGICVGTGGQDLTEDSVRVGCRLQAENVRTTAVNIGHNADGDCIEVNTSTRGGPTRLQFEVLPLLGDPDVRPLVAPLEPVDLTDLLVRGDFVGEPLARPPSPSGNVSFPGATGPFRRRADLVSGAPLSPAGAECQVRVDGQGAAIGPNGIAGDGDDVFPSAGACLLWSPPDAAGAQHPLSRTAIASTHSANQSLFHMLCTLAFDPDTGHCDFDEFNDPRTFGFLSNVLMGLGSVGGAILDGIETIRVEPNGVDQRDLTWSLPNVQFLAANPLGQQSVQGQDLGLVLEPRQAALLGCGSDFASPCSPSQAQQWLADPAIAASLTRDPEAPGQSFGGIDLLSTAASVLVQEFATVKALRAGALVGTTTNAAAELVFLPGVNYSRNGALVNVPGSFPGSTIAVEDGAYLDLTPAQVLGLSDSERAAFQQAGPPKVQADGWIEPMPWAVDPDALADFGAVVFQSDPESPLGGPGNVFNPDGGEYCGRWMNDVGSQIATPFNQTCTALEAISANFERLIVSGEIIGQDRIFDPPESLEELVAMLDGDPSNDATGDPVAGPDAIFARNQHVFSDDAMDFEVVRAVDATQLGNAEMVLAPADKAAAQQLLLSYDPIPSCQAAYCYLQLNALLSDPDDAQSVDPLLLVLPMGTNIDVVVLVEPNDPDAPVTYEPTGEIVKVNLAKLALTDLPALRRILASQAVEVDGRLVQLLGQLKIDLLGQLGTIGTEIGRDMDGDGVSDLDRDRDGVWDGGDDLSPGPVSDDEIVCGTGIRGDLLQDAVQFEPWRRDDEPGSTAFEARIGAGLAPRSPVFCRRLNALIALTGPVAGESDAFLWHGGQEAAPGVDDDADGWPDALDSCPGVANASQADADGDGVGDFCDNCTQVYNPRVPGAAAAFLAANPWATLTGGQRDDDHDGFGNVCDADFPGTSQGGNVGPADVAQFKASNGKNRTLNICGTAGTRPCAIFDLNLNQNTDNATNISPADVARFRQLNGSPAGPKCAACTGTGSALLPCQAGAQGSCN